MLHAGGKFEPGNYKTAGGLHGVGASVVNALSKDLVATVKRDGAQWEMRFKQGKAVAPLKKIGPARGTGTTVYFHPDAAIFPKIEFDPAVIRERLEVASYLHKGVKVVFEDETTNTRTVFEHAEGIVDYLQGDRHRARRQDRCTRRRSPDQGRWPASRTGAAVDRGDRRAHPLVRQRHSDRVGRHPRERHARRHRQSGAQLHRHAQPVARRASTLTAEDIREGLTGVLSVFVQEPQFQGQTKDRLNNPELLSAVDGVIRPALEHWLNHNISVAEAIVARIILSARAREASRAAQAEVVAQERDLVAAESAGQAERLHQPLERRQRAVRRRGRLGRRLGEAGTRPRAAGDSAAARQGAQHRERLAGQGAREQGAVRSGDRARLRPRQELRALEAALRQGHHPRRRRLRRQPHRDAAAHVHLPPSAAADGQRQGLPRAAAALPHRHRQGDVLGARRCAEGIHPEAAERPPRARRRSRDSKASAR